MQAAFTLEQVSHVLKKFIIDDALFSPEQKNAIYNESDLLPIYMHKKGTREDSCYFNEKLPSKNNNSDKEIENNKIDKENKENIPNSEPSRALANNEAVQTSPI